MQEVLVQITWYHNITPLDKLKNAEESKWYVRKTSENGWSRNVLVHQIEFGFFLREGKGQTNFPDRHQRHS
ncbi:MAG TPA: DUF1016 N-terminal domain-containing protein [bacterium]